MAAKSRIAGPLVLLAALFTASCDREVGPVAPVDDPAAGPGSGAFTPSGSGVFTARARFVDQARLPLISTPEERAAGSYRFRVLGEAAPVYAREDVIVVNVDGAPQPRLVLSAERVSDELILDTGPALWSDVVNSGQYGLVTQIGESEAMDLNGVVLEDVSLDGTMPIPPQSGNFDLDLCALTGDLLEKSPVGPDALCGDEKDFSFTAGATITLAGTIDSLALLDIDMRITGMMSLAMEVDGGGVVGGSPPVFAPCHSGAYLGCIQTPTGAALIEWLRKYAPEIPEASLPAVRVCIPGTKVRTRKGYWDPFPINWVPPVWRTCRITDIGTLPTVELPTVLSVDATIRPRVQGGATLYVQGDGRLGLRMPIPTFGWAGGYKPAESLEAKASLGVFVAADLQINNSAAAVRGEFDEEIEVRLQYDAEHGWGREQESLRSNQGIELVQLENPDSLVFKLSTPVGAGITLSVVSPPGDSASGDGLLDMLGLGAEAGLEASFFSETIFSREVVNPADTAIDNWHLSSDLAYELLPVASLHIPTLFFEPPFPLSYEDRFEFGRASILDQWGRATLAVHTTTTGMDQDADGYTAVVSRYDWQPQILDDGAELPFNKEDRNPPSERFEMGRDSTVVMRRPGPCTIMYSDAIWAVYGGSAYVEGARALGIAVPNYGVTLGCNMLVIARHTVELTGVADNCEVVDGAMRDEVWLQQRRFGFNKRSDTTHVAFEVVCSDAGPVGDVLVTLPEVETEEPIDIVVDERKLAYERAAQTKRLARLRVGSRMMKVANLPPYCDPVVPVSVDVVEGETTEVTLEATCTPPPVDLIGTVTVDVSMGSMGVEPPAEPYLVKLDGEARNTVSAASPAIVPGLLPETPTVLKLSSLPERCRVTGANPVVVTANADRDPLDAQFDTECTAAVEAVEGVIVTSAVPVPAVYVEGEAGSLRVMAPASLLAELSQLAGVEVRLVGVRQGTTLDVYGYELRSWFGEPRHVGVLLEREGRLWLFGERALELVDAPGDLGAHVGALVWVGGTEAGPAQLVPTVYGVIREVLP